MRALLFAIALMASPAGAACVTSTFEDTPFTTCEARVGQDLRLFLNGADGQPYGGFTGIDEDLAPKGQHLAFAMNAGMFQPDQSPVGLYIEQGQEKHRIVTGDGPGNFGLLPNGVFCIGPRLRVIESRAFAAKPANCRYATQSGPMLVIDGKLHPAFRADSASFHIRNGVGVSRDGRKAWFVISDATVNFDRFARFFRDALGAANALYFDGSVSRLYAADLGRRGAGFAVGPIVGLVEEN
jgi:prepilin-type processing-associated H-X9-DG protein